MGAVFRQYYNKGQHVVKIISAAAIFCNIKNAAIFIECNVSENTLDYFEGVRG